MICLSRDDFVEVAVCVGPAILDVVAVDNGLAMREEDGAFGIPEAEGPGILLFCAGC